MKSQILLLVIACFYSQELAANPRDGERQGGGCSGVSCGYDAVGYGTCLQADESNKKSCSTYGTPVEGLCNSKECFCCIEPCGGEGCGYNSNDEGMCIPDNVLISADMCDDIVEELCDSEDCRCCLQS